MDTVAAFNGIVDLARIGARQVISVALNYSHYAWSFYHSTSEFTRLSGLKPAFVADFLMRFIGHPTQQTEYASGFVSNISILGNLKARAIANGCHVNEAEFNKFRITRTDYILGANLQKVVDDNYNSLVTCP